MFALFPGHLGYSPGAVSDETVGDYHYSVEAAVAGMVAAQLRIDLASRGINASLYAGSLEQRVAAANAAGCKLGLSLHCDSLLSSPQTRGMHTIIYPGSSVGLSYAVEIGKQWDRVVNNIPLRHMVPASRNDLFVLRKTRFPIVLIELGFLTNVQDEAALQLDSTRDAIVTALAEATENILRTVVRD